MSRERFDKMLKEFNGKTDRIKGNLNFINHINEEVKSEEYELVNSTIKNMNILMYKIIESIEEEDIDKIDSYLDMFHRELVLISMLTDVIFAKYKTKFKKEINKK